MSNSVGLQHSMKGVEAQSVWALPVVLKGFSFILLVLGNYLLTTSNFCFSYSNMHVGLEKCRVGRRTLEVAMSIL